MATCSIEVIRGNFAKLPIKVRRFVEESIELCKPANLWICDGTEEAYTLLTDQMIKEGYLKPLPKYKNCFVVLTDPADVARVDTRTFLVTKKKEDASPTPHHTVVGELGNWMSYEDYDKACSERFPGCMKGRTMYVIPFSMGPIGGPYSKIGVEVTDSKYVVLCMRILTRIGQNVLEFLRADQDFVRCLHSVGCPLPTTRPIFNGWPCNPEKVLIAILPEKLEIKSYGSAYGSNALLGKKGFALRLGSFMGQKEGWLAEHMLVSGIETPSGKVKYIAAAFPSTCGKTNLAMLTPTVPGFKVTCVSDDIAWLRFDENGDMRAMNPETGFFGVCPGTTYHTNPAAMAMIFKNTVFINTATTSDGGVWWEGLELPPQGVTITDWRGSPWAPESGHPAAHPNARFATPAKQCPVIDPEWDSPIGVPIDALIFGGRRPDGVPLVFEALSWTHGIFVAASTRSETVASHYHSIVKVVRSDPFAMKPFFGYNFGKYLRHWLQFGNKPGLKLPKIYHVNWFRKDQKTNKFYWPGFGENIRVLDWICRRLDGKERARETAIGMIPLPDGINVKGLAFHHHGIDVSQLLAVPHDFWQEEYKRVKKFFEDQLPLDTPPEIEEEMEALRIRLTAE